MQNPTNRQHLIPKFHLKEFTLDRHIFRVDNKSGQTNRPTVGDQIFIESQLWDQRLENAVLRKIETSFHRSFREISAKGLRNTPNEETLLYIASLMARSRLKSQMVPPMKLSEEVGAMIGEMDEETKREMELRDLIILDKGGVISEKHAKGILLENQINQIVEQLSKQEWECLHLTDGYEFILSDRFLVEFPIVALSPKVLYLQPSDVIPSGNRLTKIATSKDLSEMFNSIIFELSDECYFCKNLEAVGLRHN